MTQVSGDEQDLWARAQAALTSTPPEPAHRQAARRRYDRRLVRLSDGLAGTALALAFLTRLVNPGDGPSTWRVVTALTVGVLALLLMGVGPLARPFGPPPGFAPLAWLSGRQRKELARQVRTGDALLARLSLVRLQARAMVHRRVDRIPQVGLVTGFVGLAIWDHSWWRTLTSTLLVAGMVVVACIDRRDARLARRFLEEHPAPDGGQCTNRRAGRSRGRAPGRCA